MEIHRILNSARNIDKNNDQMLISSSPTVLTQPKEARKNVTVPTASRVVGVVNFPPHEAGKDDELLAQHKAFRVNPSKEICRRGIRHIPYKSEKKSFLQKTGRDAFEVFQYTYKTMDDDREHVVLWDYNIGLVRITPFFKSCHYTKTVPAKALKESPGLLDICHSITGGALICQGYWVPYHAAKAIAATFCHRIRWALTPVFGNDFPSLCLHPQDPAFGRFLINQSIVEFCHKETARFQEEGPWYRLGTNNPLPGISLEENSQSPSRNAQLRREVRGQTAGIESGYCTDTENDKKGLCSLQTPPCGQPMLACTNTSQTRSSDAASLSSFGASLEDRSTQNMLIAQPRLNSHFDQHVSSKRTYHQMIVNRIADDKTTVDGQFTSDIRRHGDQKLEFSGRTVIHTKADIDAARMLIRLSVEHDMVSASKRIRLSSRC